MKKYLILLVLIFAFISCRENDNTDYVLLADGYIENYLIVLNNDSLICIKYDNREIDRQKLSQILNITADIEFELDDSVKEHLIEDIKKYEEDEASLIEVFVNNKNQIINDVQSLLNNNIDADLSTFFDKIDKQNVYYFDDIDTIKDSASYLAIWLEQVKGLATRKDL